MDLVTLGEALIDLPSTKPGAGLADAPSFTKVAAGAPANVAVAAQRMGLKTAFVTKVGADPFGDSIIQTFGGYGVDTSHIVKDPAARTGLAFVAIEENGEREFLFYFDPARDLALRPDELDLDALSTARAFHYGSISLIAPPARTTTLRVAGMARKAGALCTYDPNLRPRLWPDSDTMREWADMGFSEAHVAKVAADEVRFLVPDAPDEATAVQKLFARHRLLRLIAVTYGADGSAGYLRESAPITVPGVSVTPIDATGAGDAFMAGLITFLLRLGGDVNAIFAKVPDALSDALRFANACGAYATTQHGATAHLLTEEAVLELLNR
jgi:fructokinase